MPALTQSQKDTASLLALGIHVAKASETLPQTATQHLFVVTGGRVWVTMLLGQVTTVIQNSDPVAKVTATPTTGTAVDVASTVTLTSAEAGSLLSVEGDGTAIVLNTAGAACPASGVGRWVCAVGYIDLITGASKTGATKWDLFYIPFDDGASVASA